MSNIEFTQKDLDDALALITELREEINDIKKQIAVLKKTAGRSAWDTGETNFGFNKEA
jgi:peptidoglycan hydrolase CwlO-like protein